MSSILAVSVSSRIEQYGAYAGFAAVLGLAVLALLYFAQAREVKRLREWAGRAPERAAEEQERVLAEAQRRVVAQPVRQQPAAGQAPKPAAAPATPAAQQAQKPAGAPGAPGAPVPAPAAAAAATAAGAAAGAAQGAKPAGGATATEQPTTVQPGPGSNGTSGPPRPAEPAEAPKDGEEGKPAPPPAAAPPLTAAGAGAKPVTASGAGTADPPKPAQPLSIPSATASPRPAPAGARRWPEDEEPKRSHLRTTLGIVAAVAVVAIVGVVLATQLLGGGNDPKPAANTIASSTPSSDGSASSGSGSSSSNTVRPADVTVGVLNGTTVPGLARGVANRIQTKGFKIGNVTNASDQSRSATIIEYDQGHRAEALAVARLIGVGSDAVEAMGAGTRVIAGQDAPVVVTVGADQNQQPGQ